MLDRRAILILAVTLGLVLVHAYVVHPWLFPPRPRPVPLSGPATGAPATPGELTQQSGSPVPGPQEGTGQTPTPPPAGGSETVMTTPTEHGEPEKKPETVPEPLPEPPAQDVAAETVIIPSPDNPQQESFRLRATFVNDGAALKTLELLDYPISAKDNRPLPLAQELKPNYLSLVLQDRDQGLDLDTQRYRVESSPAPASDGTQEVTFLAYCPQPQLEVRKTFSLRPRERCVRMQVRVTSRASVTRKLRLQLRSVAGVPGDAPVCGMWDPATAPPDMFTEALVGCQKSTGQITVQRYAVGKVKPAAPVTYADAPCLFVGCANRYFTAALISPEGKGWTRSALIERVGENHIAAHVQSTELEFPPGQVSDFDFLFFAGPKTQDALAPYPQLQAIFNFGFFDVIARPLLWLLRVFRFIVQYLPEIIGGYGLAIIFLTFLVRLALHPLSRKAQTSMHRMSKLQPEVQKLRKKYEDDKQRMNQEMMKLYREQNINPLGGCLPMLLQIPVFIALYQVLQSSIELRGACFLWMKDLSQPDCAICLPGRGWPFIGSSLNILPVLMTILWVYQQWITPKSDDPQQAQMHKMMMFMPLVFGIMFYGMPSGLVLYFVVSSGLGIIESILIRRHLATLSEAPRPTGQIVPRKKRRDRP